MKTQSITAATFGLIIASLSSCEPARNAEARSAYVEARASAATVQASSATVASIRYVTAPTGNSARYRIREQLVGLDLPNDAVGETRGVTGAIVADANGNVIPSESKFTVDVAALKSDKDRRDSFVRSRVLETDQHPTVTFVPTSVRGVTLPLPMSGSRSFELLGNLTVRGTTRPAVWKVNAQFHPDRVTGAAFTSFTFADYGIVQPRVPVLLSVDETIKLELDFTLVSETKR